MDERNLKTDGQALKIDKQTQQKAHVLKIGQLREFNLNVPCWNIYKARLVNYVSANNIKNTEIHYECFFSHTTGFNLGFKKMQK